MIDRQTDTPSYRNVFYTSFQNMTEKRITTSATSAEETEFNKFFPGLIARSGFLDEPLKPIVSCLIYPADYLAKCCNLKNRKDFFQTGTRQECPGIFDLIKYIGHSHLRFHTDWIAFLISHLISLPDIIAEIRGAQQPSCRDHFQYCDRLFASGNPTTATKSRGKGPGPANQLVAPEFFDLGER